MSYIFELQGDIANLGTINTDELVGAGIGYISDVPTTDRLQIATDWLMRLVRDGADYTFHRQVAAARITVDADIETTTVYMRAVRDSLNTADVTLEQHGRKFTFVCPWETDYATANEWAGKIKTMLTSLKGIASVQTPFEIAFDTEMPDFATIRFPANFKTSFFRMRFWTFKEAVANLTVDKFADEQEMRKVTNLISATDDIVWYEDEPMPFSNFVRRLSGEERFFVNLSYIAGIH